MIAFPEYFAISAKIFCNLYSNIKHILIHVLQYYSPCNETGQCRQTKHQRASYDNYPKNVNSIVFYQTGDHVPLFKATDPTR